MIIKNLRANNLHEVSCEILQNESIGIAGLSGSGKSTFCSTIADESLKRIVTLLPKSEYRFLFSDKVHSNYSAQSATEMPLIFYLGKSGNSANPRSTVGTHTGVFKEIREFFAQKNNKTPEFFSFNNSMLWCEKCKGRGSTAGSTCKECEGKRYSKIENDYPIDINGNSYVISSVNEMAATDVLKYADELSLSENKKKVLENLEKLNVGYLSLDRIMSTLSGGEIVRVLLAEFMAECTDSVVIIDEISIGLDRNTLSKVLEEVSALGRKNQILLIDHSDQVLDATKEKLFFGPGSGKNGGRIVSESPRPKAISMPINKEVVEEYFQFENLHKRNLKIKHIEIPKNRITAITGESGCGKSTLVNDCIIPAFAKKHPKSVCVVIGQDKNQSITSKSTLATFLDLKKRFDKYGDDVLEMELSDVKNVIKKDKYITPKLDMLISLGLDYLSFDRKIQTLSTGEFQCVHLVSKLTENIEKEMLLIFDEPSKGLSQNILNLFLKTIRNICMDKSKTILMIEHNEFLLKNSDYVIDFGKRSNDLIEKLDCVSTDVWASNLDNISISSTNNIISSNLEKKQGIENISDMIETTFSEYENVFKGGVLKSFSQTAQWIYGDYSTDKIRPIVVFDLEKNLYSKNTFLFEVAGIVNSILTKSQTTEIDAFDFYSSDNLCECCKGTGSIVSISLEHILADEDEDLWDGMLYPEIMSELKRYNFSKIKFLFKEIKKSAGYELSKPLSKMSEIEKNVFLYGYWKESFYDTSKKTQRVWKGIVPLVLKYMRSSKNAIKTDIMDSKHAIKCPICNGSILAHEKPLDLHNGKDIRVIITEEMDKNWEILLDIPQINDVVSFIDKHTMLNTDVSLLPIEQQVRLKILEIKYANLLSFDIVLKNTAPFINEIEQDLEVIAQNNHVILLNYDGVDVTKKELLEKYFSKGKIKRNSFVYEVFGYSKISTEINKIRKKYPCKYCGGKKVLREESIFEGVDVTETPCHACHETGISDNGLAVEIDGITVDMWLVGTVKDLNVSNSESVDMIPLTKKIGDLDKGEIYQLVKYLEE